MTTNGLDYHCGQCGADKGEACRFDCLAVVAATNIIEDSIRKEKK